VSLRDLLGLYALVGFACAVAVLRRAPSSSKARALASAVVTVVLWPLWAPFALADLSALAERSGFDRAASARRLQDLESAGASDRALATARLQHDSLERLAQLRAADARALEELADLLEALRTQLVLARYAGSSADGASAIVSEVWARLEGLGAVLDPGAVTP
jgi:hypothetical protein